MQHMPQLDGLRAVAVLLVIISHTTRLDLPFDVGAFGVRLFFVLSGFLITSILLRAKKKEDPPSTIIITFYIRRFLRIFPLYYFSLLVAVLLSLPGIWETLWWHACYLTNLKMAIDKTSPPIGGHFWSLAVEEQFYLLWPFVIILTPRRWLGYVIVAAIMAAPLFRYVAAQYFYTSMARFLMPCGLDTLGMGALLALLREYRPHQQSRFAKAALLLGITLSLVLWLVPLNRWIVYSFTDTASALISVSLIYSASVGMPVAGKLLSWKPVMYLGTISYGIYVWHSFVLHFLAKIGISAPDYGLERFLIVSVGAVAIATATWFAFEKPLNGLKDRFSYSRSKTSKPISVINGRLTEK